MGVWRSTLCESGIVGFFFFNLNLLQFCFLSFETCALFSHVKFSLHCPSFLQIQASLFITQEATSASISISR